MFFQSELEANKCDIGSLGMVSEVNGCTMQKYALLFFYILLCCFDLELDAVASLPAVDQ